MKQILPIADWPHYYVSSLGVVYSDKSGTKRPIKLQLDSRGLYVFVNLNKEGKNRRVLVHRLVANAFVSNPKQLPEVHHKDGNPRNNRVDNLEWCTHRENLAHSYKLYPPTRNKNNCTLWQGAQRIGTFETIRAAVRCAESLGCSASSMEKYLRYGEYYIVPNNSGRTTKDSKTHKTQNRNSVYVYQQDVLIAECITCVEAAELLSKMVAPISPKAIQKAYTNQTLIFNTYTIKR